MIRTLKYVKTDKMSPFQTPKTNSFSDLAKLKDRSFSRKNTLTLPFTQKRKEVFWASQRESPFGRRKRTSFLSKDSFLCLSGEDSRGETRTEEKTRSSIAKNCDGRTPGCIPSPSLPKKAPYYYSLLCHRNSDRVLSHPLGKTFSKEKTFDVLPSFSTLNKERNTRNTSGFMKNPREQKPFLFSPTSLVSDSFPPNLLNLFKRYKAKRKRELEWKGWNPLSHLSDSDFKTTPEHVFPIRSGTGEGGNSGLFHTPTKHVFFPYTKSFLCYWLLPFVGFVSATSFSSDSESEHVRPFSLLNTIRLKGREKDSFKASPLKRTVKSEDKDTILFNPLVFSQKPLETNRFWRNFLFPWPKRNQKKVLFYPTSFYNRVFSTLSPSPFPFLAKRTQLETRTLLLSPNSFLTHSSALSSLPFYGELGQKGFFLSFPLKLKLNGILENSLTLVGKGFKPESPSSFSPSHSPSLFPFGSHTRLSEPKPSPHLSRVSAQMPGHQKQQQNQNQNQKPILSFLKASLLLDKYFISQSLELLAASASELELEAVSKKRRKGEEKDSSRSDRTLSFEKNTPLFCQKRLQPNLFSPFLAYSPTQVPNVMVEKRIVQFLKEKRESPFSFFQKKSSKRQYRGEEKKWTQKNRKRSPLPFQKSSLGFSPSSLKKESFQTLLTDPASAENELVSPILRPLTRMLTKEKVYATIVRSFQRDLKERKIGPAKEKAGLIEFTNPLSLPLPFQESSLDEFCQRKTKKREGECRTLNYPLFMTTHGVYSSPLKVVLNPFGHSKETKTISLPHPHPHPHSLNPRVLRVFSPNSGLNRNKNVLVKPHEKEFPPQKQGVGTPPFLLLQKRTAKRRERFLCQRTKTLKLLRRYLSVQKKTAHKKDEGFRLTSPLTKKIFTDLASQRLRQKTKKAPFGRKQRGSESPKRLRKDLFWERNGKSLSLSPRLLLNNRYFLKRNVPFFKGNTTRKADNSLLKAQNQNQNPFLRFGRTSAPLSSVSSGEKQNGLSPLSPTEQVPLREHDILQKRKSLQKKRRLTKLKKETRRRKKRMRSYPRPRRLRSRFLRLFLKQRHAFKTKKKAFIPFASESEGKSRGKQNVQKVFSLEPPFFLRIPIPKESGENVNSFFSYPAGNTPSHISFLPGREGGGLGFGIGRSDFKSAFWKSYWFRTHYKPYLQTINQALYEIKRSTFSPLSSSPKKRKAFFVQRSVDVTALFPFRKTLLLPGFITNLLDLRLFKSKDFKREGTKGEHSFKNEEGKAKAFTVKKNGVSVWKKRTPFPFSFAYRTPSPLRVFHRIQNPEECQKVLSGLSSYSSPRSFSQEAIESYYKTAYYLAEYNAITFQHIQQFVSQMRDNFTLNGQFKVRPSRLSLSFNPYTLKPTKKGNLYPRPGELERLRYSWAFSKRSLPLSTRERQNLHQKKNTPGKTQNDVNSYNKRHMLWTTEKERQLTKANKTKTLFTDLTTQLRLFWSQKPSLSFLHQNPNQKKKKGKNSAENLFLFKRLQKKQRQDQKGDAFVFINSKTEKRKNDLANWRTKRSKKKNKKKRAFSRLVFDPSPRRRKTYPFLCGKTQYWWTSPFHIRCRFRVKSDEPLLLSSQNQNQFNSPPRLKKARKKKSSLSLIQKGWSGPSLSPSLQMTPFLFHFCSLITLLSLPQIRGLFHFYGLSVSKLFSLSERLIPSFFYTPFVMGLFFERFLGKKTALKKSQKRKRRVSSSSSSSLLSHSFSKVKNGKKKRFLFQKSDYSFVSAFYSALGSERMKKAWKGKERKRSFSASASAGGIGVQKSISSSSSSSQGGGRGGIRPPFRLNQKRFKKGFFPLFSKRGKDALFISPQSEGLGPLTSLAVFSFFFQYSVQKAFLFFPRSTASRRKKGEQNTKESFFGVGSGSGSGIRTFPLNSLEKRRETEPKSSFESLTPFVILPFLSLLPHLSRFLKNPFSVRQQTHFETAFRALYTFFEKPGVLIGDWIAYLFLVEWVSDITSLLPEKREMQLIGSPFHKLSRTVYSLSALLPLSHMVLKRNAFPFPDPNYANSLTSLPNWVDGGMGIGMGMGRDSSHSLLLPHPFFFLTSPFLKRRFFHLYEIVLFHFFQSNTDCLVRQKKGIVFWTIWGDFLTQTAEKYNINRTELTTLKEEQMKLLENAIRELNQKDKKNPRKNSVFPFPFPFPFPFSFPPTDKNQMMKANKSWEEEEEEKNKAIGERGQGRGRGRRGTGQNSFFTLFPFSSSFPRLSLFLKKTFHSPPSPQDCEKTENPKTASLQWGSQQFLSYAVKSKDTDFFIDFHPPRAFSAFSSTKRTEWGRRAISPLGSLVCQIFAGLLAKQMAKNILIVGGHSSSLSYPSYQLGESGSPRSWSQKTGSGEGEAFSHSEPLRVRGRDSRSQVSLKKTMLVQAIAGETEFKIITDNASRYALVYKGVAVGIKLLRDVFDSLAFQTPCFFLIEDIHYIGERRSFLTEDETAPEEKGPSTDLNEKKRALYHSSKHFITHYKKPYKGDFSLSLPTNQFCFSFFQKRKDSLPVPAAGFLSFSRQKSSDQTHGGKGKHDPWEGQAVKLLPSRLVNLSSDDFTPPPTSPFRTLTAEKKEKKTNDYPWTGKNLSHGKRRNEAQKKEPSFSIRAKVAVLADIALSSLSVKLDMITDLLVILDSVKRNRGFVVFATTHIPFVLDPALRRPGRFDETISLEGSSSPLHSFELGQHSIFTLTRSRTYLRPRLKGRTTGTMDLSFTFSESNLAAVAKRFSLGGPFSKKTGHGLVFETGPTQFGREEARSVRVGSRSEWRSFEKTERLRHTSLSSPEAEPEREREENALLEKPKLMPKRGPLFLTQKEFPSYSLYSKRITSLFSCSHVNVFPMEGTLQHRFLKDDFFRPRSRPRPPFLSSFSSFEQDKRVQSRSQGLKTERTDTSLHEKELSSHKKQKRTQKTKLLASIAFKASSYLNASLFCMQKGRKSGQFSLSLHKDVLGGVSGGEPNSFFNPLQLSIYSSPQFLKQNLALLLSGKLGELFFFSQKACHEKRRQENALRNSDSARYSKETKKSTFCPFPKNADLSHKAVSSLLPLLNDSITSLVSSFIQKRFLYTKTKRLPFFFHLANYSSLMKPSSPPQTTILLPLKRYEHLKKSLSFYSNTEQSIGKDIRDKKKSHESQRLAKTLYNVPLKEMGRALLTQKFSGRPSSDSHSPSFLRSRTNAFLPKGRRSQWFLKKILFTRHCHYLTNQWWNGQLHEHNTETTFLSDIDWRYVFLEQEATDILVDFPDADQHYNPRNRRWIRNKKDFSTPLPRMKKSGKGEATIREPEEILSYASSFPHMSGMPSFLSPQTQTQTQTQTQKTLTFSEKDIRTEEALISSHFIYDSFLKALGIYEQNREVFDYYVFSVCQKGLHCPFQEYELFKNCQRFFTL